MLKAVEAHCHVCLDAFGFAGSNSLEAVLTNWKNRLGLLHLNGCHFRIIREAEDFLSKDAMKQTVY